MNAPAQIPFHAKPPRHATPKWWFDSVIDYMLAHPEAKQYEIAKHFGRAPNWISILLSSDSFKAKLEQRRREHNLHIHQSITLKLARSLDTTLDVLQEQIEKKRDAIPFTQLADFTNKTLERLGYGVQRPGGPASVTVNTGPQQVVTISAEDLAAARGAIRNQEASRLLEQLPAEEETSLLLEHQTATDETSE